jgi:hypothetical protein
MKITRRHVLAGAAAVTAASAVGAGGLAASWWNQTPEAELRALSPDERAFLNAVGEAWAPPGGTPALSGAEADVGRWIDDVVASMAPTQGKLFKLLLHALDAATVPTHLGRFTALPLDTRTEVLRGWLAHRSSLLRQGVNAVVVLVALAWTEHPEVAPHFRTFYRCGFGR